MSENNKKILANQIKADLQKDLEKVKKEGWSSGSLTYINRPWGGCDIPCGEEGYIVLVSTDKNKGKRDLIAPSELEKEDYEEILRLIEQVRTTGKKVTEQKKQEQEAKINQKLSGNSKLFFYEGLWEWKDYDDIRHVFLGMENGQRFYLIFPENHPATANFSKQNDYRQEKKFYLIKGVGDITFQSEQVRLHHWKEVKLTDKIMITEFKESPEKGQPVENNSKLPNSQPKEWNDKTLLEHFQTNNIESIKLEDKNLIIERNDNSTSTNPLTNFPELTGIEKYLQSKKDRSVSRNELEIGNNSHTTTKNPENNNLLLGLVIGGLIIIAAIIGLTLKKRTKKH